MSKIDHIVIGTVAAAIDLLFNADEVRASCILITALGVGHFAENFFKDSQENRNSELNGGEDFITGNRALVSLAAGTCLFDARFGGLLPFVTPAFVALYLLYKSYGACTVERNVKQVCKIGKNGQCKCE